MENTSSSSSSSDDYADVITEQQLQTLQSLIPNITDESGARTILQETHDYLQRIHEETERIERELMWQEHRSENPAGSTRRNGQGSSQGLQLIKVETEKLREGRFVVKVEWRKGSGTTAGDVQRVIESLEVTMTSIQVADVNKNPNHMLTTAFVKVKKELGMTEEELYDIIMTRFRSQT